MTTPIDLDLVELRCKLRGWPSERHSNRLHAWGPAGWVWIDLWAYGGDAVAQYGPLLTAPRWTLERLLSEPPEGWRFERCPCGNAGHPGWLHWGEEIRRPFDAENALHEVTLEIFVGVSGVTTKPFVAASRHQGRLAEAFKAAADLALILAEVEP